MKSTVDWKAPKYWKRVTCIMRICVGLKKMGNLSWSSMLECCEAVRGKLENCDGDTEKVVSSKGYSRCSDFVHKIKFVQILQKNAGRSKQNNVDLGERDGCREAAMKKALNEDLRYSSYTRRKGPITHPHCPKETTYKIQETP